ncbi:hypothetical protein P3W45_000221 [Vairimorpha bombi]
MSKKISKRNYRQRAHSNPFKDVDITIPTSPDKIDWMEHFINGRCPSYLDIGCGYGKFIMELSKNENINVLGLEIRDKVFEYVKAKKNELNLANLSIMKTNALLFLPNIFMKKSLEKIFILFPDPHFKKRKQKGRVVCRQTINIYEYILRDDGRLYISTDVEHLFNDMVEIFKESGLFGQLPDSEIKEDPYYELTYKNTDEALRAGAKTGATFATIFKKYNF